MSCVLFFLYFLIVVVVVFVVVVVVILVVAVVVVVVVAGTTVVVVVVVVVGGVFVAAPFSWLWLRGRLCQCRSRCPNNGKTFRSFDLSFSSLGWVVASYGVWVELLSRGLVLLSWRS